MLAIFKDRPINSITDVIAQIVSTVAQLETSPFIQEAKGRRRKFEAGVDNKLLENYTEENQTIFISSDCIKTDGSLVVMDDFPLSMQFGNGVTLGASILLQNGERMTLSWCVFPSNMDTQVLTKLLELKAAFK